MGRSAATSRMRRAQMKKLLAASMERKMKSMKSHLFKVFKGNAECICNTKNVNRPTGAAFIVALRRSLFEHFLPDMTLHKQAAIRYIGYQSTNCLRTTSTTSQPTNIYSHVVIHRAPHEITERQNIPYMRND
ncbi:hypothetical protein Tcan_14187 [Toxocara canis]|uniref:Uncharacterized protein n=1 Tax=Toxocara canis TaxID=6265 RepID=A0A0B2VWH6_TOXCA|nr:hypothetical protein Tcan_14187 [Toxocara canis]